MAEYSSSPRKCAHLIPGWTSAWRLWSVRIATIGAVLMTGWSSLPSDVRAALPYADHMAAVLFIAVTVARLIAQEKADRDGAGDGDGDIQEYRP